MHDVNTSKKKVIGKGNTDIFRLCFKKLAKVGSTPTCIILDSGINLFCFFKWVVICRQQNIRSGSYP